jgi:hypothetical protein
MSQLFTIFSETIIKVGKDEVLRYKEKIHLNQNHPFNKVLYKNVITLYI